MRYGLWIDDRRNPDQHNRPPHDAVLLWARDVEQAKFYVRRHGMPETMYLDHDLGLDSNGAVVTVMEFLRWLADLGLEPVFNYRVISQNPDGAKSIVSFLESWRRVASEKEV